MVRTAARTRRAVTLIEMMVVMALIAALAAMAMVIAPGALDKDRASAAVSQIEGALQITRARAQRDGLPRGVRLLCDPTSTNPEQVTAYQYIEYTPIFVPNPGATLVRDDPYYQPSPGTSLPAPYVQFLYTTTPIDTGSGPMPGTGPVTATGRACQIVGLHASHWTMLQGQITSGNAILSLPLLGGVYTITGLAGPQTPTGSPLGTTFTVPVSLQSYPDDQLGATTRWRTYHFGLYGSPRVLLGEPTMQLPAKTCVDLSLSLPVGTGGADYDILFAPSGQLIGGVSSSTAGAGQVFLWIRDPKRPKPVPGNAASFEAGGEQLITVIKARSGAVGSAPVDWGADPFLLAKKAISGQ